MAVWYQKVQLKNIFHNEEMTFEQRRDAIVAKIKKLDQWDGDHTEDVFYNIVDGLERSEDEDDFDYWWDMLYDWADDERVWVETF